MVGADKSTTMRGGGRGCIGLDGGLGRFDMIGMRRALKARLKHAAIGYPWFVFAFLYRALRIQ